MATYMDQVRGSPAVLEKRTVSAVMSGNKVALRGPYNETLQEFFQSLPNADWDRSASCWTCDVTPAACWRITSQCPCDVEADEEVTRIGHRFYEPVLRPKSVEPKIVRTAPRAHQLAAYSFAFPRDATLLNMWMGLGKTLVAIQLSENWGCRRVLILCPVAVRGVWRREFAKHSAQDWLVTVLESGGTAKKLTTALLDAKLAEARNQPHAIIVNYDTAKLKLFADWAKKQDWDLVIADESHRAKGNGSATAKFVAKVGRAAKRRLALTGTPMPHSPLDLFEQFRFLDRGIYGTSFHRFRTMFAIQGPFGASHIVGFKNQDELGRRMGLITFTAGAEMLDLPKATHIDIPVTLGAEARRVYDEMESDLIAFLADGGEISAANGLVKRLRLQQITGGFCKRDDETIERLGTEKQEALADIIEDLNEPVVVFCQFREDLATVERVAESLGRRFGELSGSRKDLTPDATMPETVDVLATQTQAGGVGVDLTRARVAVYFNAGDSMGNHEQSLSRLHRPGQTRPVVYYHLVGIDTIDRAIYGSLMKKRAVVDEVLSYLTGDQYDE